ncbi:hypothetical protein BJ684DRAFT_20444 [Piptocephalis cylindrospora]|uniref:Uncharacterized protein n=1 Tax=Piptocephalis cylindrospora TaxID=1907219 RepID=A0A4P9Y2C6_9FUNG|nr:hypothetical protein BJ684DRAFT_20444 [Piptocephalis cylindrospora]|eukprot:RKP13046.1 hypothetical protein BJ684DRAFT_20444 [Piptocephalis cylindrospora]
MKEDAERKGDPWVHFFPEEDTLSAALKDVEDEGISRCPDCAWEIVGGMCTRCQRIFPELMDVRQGGGAVDSQDETDISSEEEEERATQNSLSSRDYLYRDTGSTDEDEDDGIDLLGGSDGDHRSLSARQNGLILGQHSGGEEEEEEGEESDDSFVVDDDCVEMDSDVASDGLSDDEMDEQEYPSGPVPEKFIDTLFVDR